MMPGDETQVLAQLEELVRGVPLPGTTAAEDTRRGQRRQRRRHAAIAATAAAAVAVVVSSVAVITGGSDEIRPAPAPSSPTGTSTAPAPAIDLRDLTKQEQDRLFARTLDRYAAVVQEHLSGDRVGGQRLSEPVLRGGKDTVRCYCPSRYHRAPWTSATLLAGEYRWRSPDGGTAGELVISVGDRSTLPCTEEPWDCHAIDVPGAPLALAGTWTCDPSCGFGESLLPSDRWVDGRYDVVSVDRADHLVVTVAFAHRGTEQGLPATDLAAAAADPRLTLPWTHPAFETVMPPPLVSTTDVRSAATRTFVGPDQEWHEDGFFYDHGAPVGSLSASVEAGSPWGESGIGHGGDADCYPRLHERCENRTVQGRSVIIKRDTDDGSVTVIYLGPRYNVEVLTGGALPGFDVDAAARFVTMDRWQPDWQE